MHIWFLTLGKLASNWFPSPLVRTHLPLPQPRRKGELFTSEFYGSCWVRFFLGKSKGGLSLLGFTMSLQSFSNGTIYIHDHWNLVSMRTLIQEFWGGAWDCAFPNKHPADTVAGPETTLWALRSYPRFSNRRIELSLRMLSLNETMGQIPSSRMAEMAWLPGNSSGHEWSISKWSKWNPKNLDDLLFVSKWVIYYSYQRDQPRCPSCLTGNICTTRNTFGCLRNRGSTKEFIQKQNIHTAKKSTFRQLILTGFYESWR